MRAFHGTSRLYLTEGEFKLVDSTHGTFGAGIYLGDADVAAVYADSFTHGVILEYEVDTEDFKVIEASYPVGEKYDLETPALPLIAYLFDLTLEEAAQWFQDHTVDGFLLGKEIQEQAIKKGHKGLLLDYGDCFELVAFDNNQLQKVSLSSKL